MTKTTANAAAVKKLESIREEIREICEPRYHEFHKDVIEHGFIKITIPKKRR